MARYRERLQAASVVTVSFDEHDVRDSDDESTTLADNAPDPNAVDPAEEASRRDAIASLVQKIGRLRRALAHGPRPLLPGRDDLQGDRPGPGRDCDLVLCQIHTAAILAFGAGWSTPMWPPVWGSGWSSHDPRLLHRLSGAVSAMTQEAVVADNIANSNTVGLRIGAVRERPPSDRLAAGSTMTARWVEPRRRAQVRASQR